MRFYQLAFRYLYRKKSKALILLMVLLFINSMILGSYMILRATEDSRSTMQEKMGTKVVLEVKGDNQMITEDEVKAIREMEGVIYVNRLTSGAAYPVDFNPVTSSDSEEENNWKVTLLSYDDLERDSAFSDLRYRLMKGNLITEGSEKGAVVNFRLVEANGLEIGDEIKVGTESGRVTGVKIIGVFVAGSERKQMDTLPAVNRIENQIFLDNESYAALSNHEGYRKIAVYTRQPDQVDALVQELQDFLGNRTESTTADVLYRQLEAPLNRIVRVMRLMLIFTLTAGATVTSLLLCMWMRSRKREIAVFISMGKQKADIFMQLFLETAAVFCLSVFGACALGSGMAGILEKLLMEENTAVLLSVSLQAGDMAAMVCAGGCIAVIAVCISLLPILRANPKDILSKMEG
ncbi:MAG: ABC transporter permease [Lachnospiraceae bacterium]|uniref:ABC transporter permease n=1 Tax=uncultured Acetatifactor sp. TaxID=1671927 RepID=UPI002617DE77|nr:ABC transporter permease [uncultured Acetatifactor sp.]MCI8789812.1 ABC transporter permease [Lachnospiraceae bacterium]